MIQEEDHCADERRASAPKDNDHLKEEILNSKDLFRGRREIRILHNDEIYRLLITRNEKLILHK